MKDFKNWRILAHVGLIILACDWTFCGVTVPALHFSLMRFAG